MKIRDATAEDLPAIVGIYNPAVPTRVSTADTGSISARIARPGSTSTTRREGLVRRLVGEAISRAPGLGIKTLAAGIFAHNEASVALFEGLGFETWARFPGVAEHDGIRRDLVEFGLRLDKDSRERGNA